MNRQASRFIRRSLVIGVGIAFLLTACGGGAPATTPAATATPVSNGPSLQTQPVPQLAPTATPEQPATAPPPSSGVAPGTVMLDQTTNVSVSSGNVEMDFTAGAWQVVRVDASEIGGVVDFELRLVDAFNNIIGKSTSIQSEQGASIDEFTLPYDGMYRVVLAPSNGDGSVQVKVTALDAPSGGGQVSLGDSLTGTMSVKVVYHTYQVSLTGGAVVTFAAVATTNGQPDPSLVLYGPDGRFVAEADDVQPPDNLNAVLPGFVAKLAGPYVAIIGNYGGTMGGYTFSVTSDTTPPQAQGEPDLVYDKDYRAALYEGSVFNATFDGTVGDPLRIEAFGVTTDLKVDLRVYSPFNQVIAYAIDADYGQDSAINEMQLPYSGRYRVEITPHGTGQASFHLKRLAPSDLTGGGVFGDNPSGTRSGRINASDVYHYFQFNANGGEKITLRITSTNIVGALDMGFAVLGPDGQQVVFADDSQGSNPLDPDLEKYQIEQTGTYTIVVYSFTDALGTYELSYSREQ